MDRLFFADAELRASGSGDQYVIEGRAVAYNKLSNWNVPVAGVCERIAPGAFREHLASDDHDVVALRDHQSSQILGRESNGSLKLFDRSDGLYFRIQLNPDVVAHRDLHALVKDQTVHECSFAFVIENPDTDQELSRGSDDDGKRCIIRTVKRAKIVDVSVVTAPAYGNNATSAQARAEEPVSSEFDDAAAALEAFAQAQTAKKKAEDEVRKAEEALRETRERFETVRLF
jgi:HK97 family phage prohead protease